MLTSSSPSEKGESPGAIARPTESAQKAGASAAGAPPVDGLTIEDYSKMHSVTEAEIWRRLRRGELFGRSQKGHLIIYKSQDGSAASAAESVVSLTNNKDGDQGLPDPSAALASADLADLPPLPPPGAEGALPGRSGASAGSNYLTLTGERGASPELALLLDHLSLAKEENREILRMTQESIRKVSELSDTVVEMKDAVIEAKESQIMALREQLAARDHDLRKLRQQNEDLEMLSRAIASEKKKK